MELIVILFLLFFYFLPAMIAWSRGHPSTGAILALNLFLGWTLLGWIISLVWSFTNPSQVVVNNETNISAADEIRKLAKLKQQGLLTAEEFNKKKSEILNKV